MSLTLVVLTLKTSSICKNISYYNGLYSVTKLLQTEVQF